MVIVFFVMIIHSVCMDATPMQGDMWQGGPDLQVSLSMDLPLHEMRPLHGNRWISPQVIITFLIFIPKFSSEGRADMKWSI